MTRVLALALVLVALAAPAIGSFHETIGVAPDRAYALVMQGTSFNGLHAPHAPLLEAYVGERVRFWLAAAEAHTFHLHGHPWLADGVVVDTFLVDPDEPHAFDVPAGGPDGHPGDWMYHCHIDDHMQAGMWGIFRVYPFRAGLARVGHAVEVTLDRLGEPVHGASLVVKVGDEVVPAHVQPAGGGRFLVHADWPTDGVLVVEAAHPRWGTSVARLSLDGSAIPLPTVGHAHPS